MIDGVEIVTGVEVRANIFETKIKILGCSPQLYWTD
jgi:hypothetical protein